MKKYVLCFLAAVVGAPFNAMPVRAAIQEEAFFGEIPSVTSTGFFAQKASQAPGSIYVISQKMLTEHPVQTLQNSFDAFLPGVAAGAEHVHLGPHFDVRGVQSPIASATLYMLNGNSFTDRLFTGYQWGQGCPLIGDIDRMEVILGPGSLVHGGGAMMGYVNVLQKNGADYSGITTAAEYGYPNQLKKAEVNYGTKYGEGKDLYVYGGFVQADGSHYKDDFLNPPYFNNTNHPMLPVLTQQRVKEIDPSYRVSTNYRNGAFKFTGFVQDYHSSIDSPNLDDSAAGRRRDTVMMAAPEYTFNFNEQNSLQIVPSALMHDTIRKRYVDPTATGNNIPTGVGAGFVEEGAATTMFRGKAVYRTTALPRQKLALGVDASHSTFYLGKSLMNASVSNVYEGLPGNWTESSAFFEDVVAVSEKLQASAGLRYDQVQYGVFNVATKNSGTMTFQPDKQSNPSARLAAAYEINNVHSVKLSVQQGFSYPTPGQLQWWGEAEAVSIAGGFGKIPAIKAAQETSYEANYRGDFKDLKLTTDLNVYANVMKDWINWDGTGAAGLTNPAQILYLSSNTRLGGQHWVNFPNTTNIGTELTLKYAPTSASFVSVAYAFSQPYETRTGVNVYSDYPTHQIKANGEIGFAEKFTFAVDVIVENSAPVDTTYGAPGSFSQDTRLFVKPRFVLSSLLGYKVNERLSASVSAYNMTGNKNMPKGMSKGYFNRDQMYTFVGVKYKL